MKKTKCLLVICVFFQVIWVTAQSHQETLAAAALSIIDDAIDYDPAYFSIAYPNGDVPEGKGVCTDVIIRAYRKMGVDLQREVHEDMKANFDAYPNLWGLSKTDTNIDHRRVPNLRTFFSRNGRSFPITMQPENYIPGDVVSWDLGNGITHIGMVVDTLATDTKRPLIVHNIGAGQVVEDVLFAYKITGHYRY